LSGLGGPISEQDSTESSTEQTLTSENDGTVSSMKMYIIILATATIIAIGIATLAYKKKHKSLESEK